MKSRFFTCIFEDATKSYFIASYSEDVKFGETRMLVRTEFESDARRLQAHMTLRGLQIESFMPENDEVIDEPDALSWIIKRINKLYPQFPDVLRSEENKIHFLRG